MSKNEKELIEIIRTAKNPQVALLTAISVIENVIICDEDN